MSGFNIGVVVMVRSQDGGSGRVMGWEVGIGFRGQVSGRGSCSRTGVEVGVGRGSVPRSRSVSGSGFWKGVKFWFQDREVKFQEPGSSS